MTETNIHLDPTDKWHGFLTLMADVFTSPGFNIFTSLISGWVLSPGRRTITQMICAGDPTNKKQHDAYHRFVRCGRWSMDKLWQCMVVSIVLMLSIKGPLVIDIDDTLFKKTGRKIQGTGIFRDAVRSTKSKVVYSLGLNLVVATLRVNAPWGGCPIGLPIGVRLHKKGGPTTVDLAEVIAVELSRWFKDRHLEICADGAYASLIGRHIPNATITSRMRKDAALFEAAPEKTLKPGRPRCRGARLKSPDLISKDLNKNEFTSREFNCRGKQVQTLLWSKRVLWYAVDKTKMVTLVIVRDPDGICPDDFFVTDNESFSDVDVTAHYSGRWSIEVTFRDVKQCLGGEDPQSWKGEGPERAANLSFWLYSAIWTWHITTYATTPTWIPRPWYLKKRTPSFIDALASLRRTLWTERIKQVSLKERYPTKIIEGMIDILANAA